MPQVATVFVRFPFQIHNLEETLQGSKQEYGQRLTPLNKLILELQDELKEVRSQVARHVETNNNLLCVKMKLEAEIENYQRLIHGITAEPERWGLNPLKVEGSQMREHEGQPHICVYGQEQLFYRLSLD